MVLIIYNLPGGAVDCAGHYILERNKNNNEYVIAGVFKTIYFFKVKYFVKDYWQEKTVNFLFKTDL